LTRKDIVDLPDCPHMRAPAYREEQGERGDFECAKVSRNAVG
jgi:hypothetical protein